jgi:hypothetical protein
MLQIEIDSQNQLTLSFTHPLSKQLTIAKGSLALPAFLGNADYDPEAVLAHGRGLRDALLNCRNVHDAFLTALNATVRATPPLPLNIHLVLPKPSASPSLHKLAWETLLEPGSGDQPLLGRSNAYFTRYIQTTEPISPPPIRPRALVLIANPERLATEKIEAAGVRLHPVKVAEELARARLSLRALTTDAITSQPGQKGLASLDRLQAALNDPGKEAYHILYLVCHGAHYGGKSQLWLDQLDGKPVDAQLLVDALQGLDPTRRPRLVVLAACQSAGQPETGVESSVDHGQLAAIGPRLVEQAGIPAVVAMQGNVYMRSIEGMMPAFFQELVRSGRVDRAMAAARGRMRIQTNPLMRAQWRVPVLFSCLADGQLWPASQVKPRTVYLSHALQPGDAEYSVLAHIRRILQDGGFEVVESEPYAVANGYWSRRLLDGLGACDAAVLLFNQRALCEPDNWVQVEARILCWRRWLEEGFQLLPLCLGAENRALLQQGAGSRLEAASALELTWTTTDELETRLRELLEPLWRDAGQPALRLVELEQRVVGHFREMASHFKEMGLPNVLEEKAQRLQAELNLPITPGEGACWWARVALSEGPITLSRLYNALANLATPQVRESIKGLLGPVQPAWVDISSAAQLTGLTASAHQKPGAFYLRGMGKPSAAPAPLDWIAKCYAARACGMAYDVFTTTDGPPLLIVVSPVKGNKDEWLNQIGATLCATLQSSDPALWAEAWVAVCGAVSDPWAEDGVDDSAGFANASIGDDQCIDEVIKHCIELRFARKQPVLLMLPGAAAAHQPLRNAIQQRFGSLGFFFMGKDPAPIAAGNGPSLASDLAVDTADQAYATWSKLKNLA